MIINILSFKLFLILDHIDSKSLIPSNFLKGSFNFSKQDSGKSPKNSLSPTSIIFTEGIQFIRFEVFNQKTFTYSHIGKTPVFRSIIKKISQRPCKKTIVISITIFSKFP